MSGAVAGALAKVFMSKEDMIKQEQEEMWGQTVVVQRLEIDFWKGVSRVALVLGSLMGALITSATENKFGISLWMFLQGLT